MVYLEGRTFDKVGFHVGFLCNARQPTSCQISDLTRKYDKYIDKNDIQQYLYKRHYTLAHMVHKGIELFLLVRLWLELLRVNPFNDFLGASLSLLWLDINLHSDFPGCGGVARRDMGRVIFGAGLERTNVRGVAVLRVVSRYKIFLNMFIPSMRTNMNI